jgi:hypothetical protein
MQESVYCAFWGALYPFCLAIGDLIIFISSIGSINPPMVNYLFRDYIIC